MADLIPQGTSLNVGRTAINQKITAMDDTAQRIIAGTALADQSITKRHLNFIPTVGKRTKNLFDKNDVTANKYVSNTDGQLKDPTLTDTTYYASGIIPVIPNTTYTMSRRDQGAFYTSTGAYISGISGSSSSSYTFTTPSNAASVRVTVRQEYLNDLQIELGTTSTAYSPFIEIEAGIPDKSVTVEKLGLDDQPRLTLGGAIRIDYANSKIMLPISNNILFQKSYKFTPGNSPFKEVKLTDYPSSTWVYSFNKTWDLQNLWFDTELFKAGTDPFIWLQSANVPTYKSTLIHVLSVINGRVNSVYPLQRVGRREDIPQYSMFQAASQTPLEFNLLNRTISVPIGYIIGDLGYDNVTVATTLTDTYQSNAGMTYLLWNYTQKQLQIKSFTDFYTFLGSREDYAVIASWFRGNDNLVHQFTCPSPHTLVGKPPVGSKSYGMFVGEDSLNFDFTAKKVYIPFGFIMHNNGGWYTPADARNTLTAVSGYKYELAFPTSTQGIQALVYETITDKYTFLNYAEFTASFKSNMILLYTFYESRKRIFGIGPIKVDGKLQGVQELIDANKTTAGAAIFTGSDYFNFDFVAKKIYIPNGFVVHNGGWYSPNTANNTTTSVSGYKFELTFPTYGFGIQAVFYDYNLNKFVVLNYQDFAASLNNKMVLLYTFYDTSARVFGAGPVKINGVLQGGGSADSVAIPFSETTDRLLLPPKMFFVQGNELPIYKSSIISSFGRDIEDFKISLKTESSGVPRVRHFYEDIVVKPEDLQATLRFAIKQRTNQDNIYYKDVTRSFVDPATKSGQTKTMLMIGDSITNRNLIEYTKTKLAAWGVTVNMVGTMTNQTNVRGEGREGWEYQHFIGADNTHGTTTITRLPDGTTDSTLYQNPFLKLAIASDISNHPDWCFRNTGANVELSYTQDTDKTGNFYIFDFTYYLAQHGVSSPDIVTIALSTNDFSQESTATALANCRLGLEIMVKQIKAALPGCKIGIVPTPVYGSNVAGNTRWINAATWIEQAIADVASFGLADVQIIPVWAHMNREHSFDWSAGSNITALNDSKKSTIPDMIHLSTNGKWEYVNALSAFVMNVI